MLFRSGAVRAGFFHLRDRVKWKGAGETWYSHVCMAYKSGGSNMVGKLGSLLSGVGVLVFFLGVFGFGKMLVLAGVGLIVVGLVSYFIEEFGGRRA